MESLADPFSFTPGCELVPGTEACAGRLVDDAALEVFADLIGSSCGALSLLAPTG